MFAASKTASVSGGYQISRSLRFNSADTTNLNRTFASAGNRRTFTLSFWLKRSRVGVDYEGFFASGNGTDQIRFENIDQLRFSLNSTASGDFVTTQVFRDVSAWYHIVFAVDTTQATSTNRVKIYVNGSQITSFTTSSYPTLNYDCNFNNNVSHRLGIANDTSYPFNGYITETYLIDGQALTPSSFGETNAQTGVWQPKAYAGSYGTNGFYLNFSDNSNTTAATLGKDYSGNGNNWTPNNFSVTAGAGNDSLVDSPTSYGTDTGVGGEVRGNYSTLNPIDGVGFSATNGNLDVTVSSTTGAALSTISVSSGKWYWEVVGTGGGAAYMVGVANASAAATTKSWQGANGWYYYSVNGNKYTNGGSTSYGGTYATNSVIGVALDMDAGTLTFYRNGVSQGIAYSVFSGLTVQPALSSATGTELYSINFGQRPFAYTAPSGYKALCTQNLPTPTIGATTATQAGKYFNPVLWTGNSSTQSVTGVGFAPEFVWIKSRSGVTAHCLYDIVRGAPNWLGSNQTTAEQTYANLLTAFGSDGFTVGSDSWVNSSGNTYVAWNWKANGSGSTNTSGSITSTVSANTTSGFSVVTYTNASSGTVGHGLGVAPAMVIYKDRTNVTNWVVLHQSLTNMSNYYLKLNLTDAVATGITLGGNPTSSVIYTNTNIIQNGAASVAYCFAEISGYSKAFSYTGNGSTDGAFVYCGFRPAYVMIKRTDAVSSWEIHDTTRATYNVDDKNLYANLSDAEATYAVLDELSNGFKLRTTLNGTNASGGTYIGIAFASAPFKYSLAR